MSHLGNIHEIVGTLTDIISEDGQMKVLISAQKEIMIPDGALSIGELKELLGSHIAITNVDNQYRIRVVRR